MPANQSTLLNPQAQLTPSQWQQAVDLLERAAQGFVHKTPENEYEIWAASEDWFFEPWGRDTFISLPGLLLSTERFEEARCVFLHFARYERKGLIPNRILPDSVMYNTVDASLWFIVSLEKYLETTGQKAFVLSLLPVVRNIIQHYKQGTYFQRQGRLNGIMVDSHDGLVMCPPQTTWMDADPSGAGDSVVTPRDGKPVEINALWYRSLRFFASLTEDRAEADKATKLANQVKISFNQKFWNEREQCLLDVVEGDPHTGAIRPNQIFAVSHGGDLLSPQHQAEVLHSVSHDLLTPCGLRTLSPRDSYYKGHYDTFAPMDIKDWAYHQGTVWPWLLGPYIDALHIIRSQEGADEEIIQQEIRGLIMPLCDFLLNADCQSLPEVFSGDTPHEPGGTRSQAWSVSEILRVIRQYDLA